MELGCISVSHKKAKVEEIEKILKNFNPFSLLSSYPLSEFAFLYTCNRFEVYVIGFEIEQSLKRLAEELRVAEVCDYYFGDDCIRHLMRVCSGIESMIVGENEILGQVKRAFYKCEEMKTVGENLQRIFSKAIQVGSKIRRETGISKGALSVGSAAVELAEKVLGSLKGKKVLIVGAGEMGQLVARAIRRDAETIFIANRTFSKAEELAKKLNGIAVRFDKLVEFLEVCDVVISATSAPHVVITKEQIAKAMEKRKKKLVIIDIALPRDVEETVKELDGVELFNIDDLREISEENLRKRLDEVRKAEEIIEKELEQFKNYLQDLKAQKAISAMYSLAGKYIEEEVDELQRELEKLGLRENVKPVLRAFAFSLIKKFLSRPSINLKKAAREGDFAIINAVLKVFGDGNVPECEDEKAEKGESKGSLSGVKVES